MPHFAGVNGVQLDIKNLHTAHPKLSKLIGPGTFNCLSDSKFLAGQYCGRGTAIVYAWMKKAEDWHETCGIDWADAQSAKRQLIDQYYSDWHHDLQDLVFESEDTILPRPIYSLPENPSWETDEW